MINYVKVLPPIVFGFISFIFCVVGLYDMYIDDKPAFESLCPCIVSGIIALIFLWLAFG